MKKLLLVGLCFVGLSTNAMQQQAELRARLLAHDGDVELEDRAVAASSSEQVVIEQVPATPVHVAGSASADNSPVKSLVEADFQALLASPEVKDLFQKEPVLAKLFIAQEQRMEQIFEFVKEMQEADKEHSLSKKQRAITSATELGILTPGMMVYSFYLDRGGYNTAAIVQHYVANSWIRNLADINPLGKIIGSLLAVAAAQGLDYHVAIPNLGYALGLAPLTLFVALGVILGEVKKGNPIVRTKETIRQSAIRFGKWVKSLRVQKADQLPL